MEELAEGSVRTVCDFTGLDFIHDRDLVKAALRAKQHNTEAVVSEFYEDPDKFRETYNYTWSELPFLTERDGTLPASSQIPSFSIQSPDEGSVIQGIPLPASVPPSRPPSRATNNRSPLGAPSTRAQEEADFQRALAESAAESGLPAPAQMETGITGPEETNLPFFGPAVRDYHEQNNWAMVPLTRDTPDPLPTKRKREQGAPAFLRCRKDGADRHRLGAVLAIHHEIPLARNAFLEMGTQPSSYGINNSWWKGDPIVPVESQQTQQQRDDQMWDASVPPPEPDFAHELHRLMAFLDMTDRAYGTADMVGDLRALSGNWGIQTVETRFFHALRDPAVVEKAEPFFWTVQMFPSVPPMAPEDEPPETDAFALLETRLSQGQYAALETLYDAWDELFWQDYRSMDHDSDWGMKPAAITKAGEVITMTFANDGFLHPIEIPGVFYIDRYMAEAKDAAVQQQLKIRELRRQLGDAEAARIEAEMWTDPTNGNRLSIRKMCEASIEDYALRDRWLRDDALWRKWREADSAEGMFIFLSGGWFDRMVELTEEERERSAYYQRMIAVMRQELEDLDKSVQRQKDHIRELETEIRSLSRKCTVPAPEDGWNPKHRYSLRGVATTDDTVYLARRAEQNLIELDGVSPPSDQWWKLSYGASGTDGDPIHVSMTTLGEVTEAACTETRTPILVYASDKAMEAIPKHLPEDLRTFVKFDNRYFRQEQIEQRPDAPPPSRPLPPVPSQKPPPPPVPAPNMTSAFSPPSSNSGSPPPLDRAVPGPRVVRTSSTEVSVGSRRSSDTAMADEGEGYGDVDTEMADMMLVDHQELTPSSSASTANIHTPSTLTDPPDTLPLSLAQSQPQQQPSQQQTDEGRLPGGDRAPHSIIEIN